MELKTQIIQGAMRGKAGLKDIAADLGMDAVVIEKLQSMTHRNNAGYNCPYPAYTFVKYREAPTAMAMKGAPEPGCLVSDLAGFASLLSAGMDPGQALEQCYRLGLEPSAAARSASTIGALDALAENGALDAPAPWPLPGNPDAAIMAASKAFSTTVPPKGLFADKDKDAGWWLRRQALAVILGIDPVIMLMAPEITEAKIAELVQVSAEWEDFSVESLQGIVSKLIEQNA
jgi:hypothetical protein